MKHYNNNLLQSIIDNCSTNYDVRLVNGSTSSEGRLEVCYVGYWRSFCGSIASGFAATACNQLGFSSNNRILK